jgi:hypothetical protein
MMDEHAQTVGNFLDDRHAESRRRIAALEAELEEAKRWKDAVDDAGVVHWTLTSETANDPRKAIGALLDTNAQWALDPAISSDAAHLRDTHLHRAETAALELADERKRRKMWQARAEAAGVAMALFASCIKGGEPWSEQCEAALLAAMKD